MILNPLVRKKTNSRTDTDKIQIQIRYMYNKYTYIKYKCLKEVHEELQTKRNMLIKFVGWS